MTNLDTRYRFLSNASPEDEPLSIIRFEGTESVSNPFDFTIELKSRSADIDIDGLLSSPCSLEIIVGGKSRVINGILAEFDTVSQLGDFIVYRATMVPRLWQLSLYSTNEVYIDQNVPDIIKTVLEEGGFTALDYEMRLLRDYKDWPFRCQYGESHLNFISRLMEHEGIYYFFEHVDDVDKIIFCDNLNGQDPIDENSIRFAQPSGLDGMGFPDAIYNLVCRQKRLPRNILLKDYNDENPSIDIRGEAEIDPKGVGEVYDYGSNIESPEEGQILAKIRAEEIACHKKVYFGEGMVARMLPGFTFEVVNHFKKDINQAYQLLSITHEGHEPSLLSGEATDSAAYRNNFTAIAANVQYRPEKDTPKPQFYGTMEAFIDAEGDGEYAEIDATGRYKVVLPFDRTLRQESKASCWVRMQQPYAGESEGMHFPLRKGAEVLLTFIGGDPDRPVISGAVPNHAKPSVVTDTNQTKNVIQTSKGNKIEIEDRDDCKRIKLHSPHKNTYMHLGAPNHAGDGWVVITEGMERKEIGGGQQLTVLAQPTQDGNNARTITEQGNDASTKTSSGTGRFLEIYGIPDEKPIMLTGLGTPKDGTWKYRIGTGSWTTIGHNALSDSNRLYLREDATVAFQPNNTCSGGARTFNYVEALDPKTETLGNPAAYMFSRINSTTNYTLPQYPSTLPDTSDHYIDGRAIKIKTVTDNFIALSLVTHNSADMGSWEYSLGNDVWKPLPTTSATNTLFLPKDSDIRFTPKPHTPGSKAIRWKKYRNDYYWEDKYPVIVPADNCDIIEVVVEPGFVKLPTSAVTGGKWQYQTSPGSFWGDFYSPYFYEIQSGGKLRFIPSAKASGQQLSITHYVDNAVSGTYLPKLSTADPSPLPAATVTIEAAADDPDYLDEQEIFTFNKKDAKGNHAGTNKATLSFTQADELTGNYLISRRWGDEYSWTRGNQHNFADSDNIIFNYGNAFEVHVDSEGVDTEALIAELKTIQLTGVYQYQLSGGGTKNMSAVSADPDKTKWETLFSNGQVRIGRHDVVNLHYGNVYDFGGTFNYNLGNGYEENYLVQSTEINKDYGMDLLNIGGPKWESFKTDLSGETLSTHQTGYITDSIDQPNQGLCVAKNIEVPTYDFNTECTGIEINDRCSSLEINKGAKSVELNFNGDGNKTSWSKSGGGNSYEKNWYPGTGHLIHEEHKWVDGVGINTSERNYDPETGALTSYETGHKGHGVHKFEFTASAKASTSFEFSATTSFSFSVSTALTMSVSAAVTTSFELSGSAKITVALVGGVHLKLEKESVEVYVKQNGAFINGDAVALEKEFLKLRKLGVKIDSAQMNVDQATALLTSNSAEVRNSMITLIG